MSTTSEKKTRKRVFLENGLKKQAGVAILIPNKIDIQPKVTKQDKKGHFMFIKEKHSPGEIINSEHLCSKCNDTHIHKRNFTEAQNTH